jgi:hypothetical protein
LDTLNGVVDRLDRYRGEQQPCDRLHLGGRLDFTDLTVHRVTAGKAFGLAMLRGAQGSRTKAQG